MARVSEKEGSLQFASLTLIRTLSFSALHTSVYRQVGDLKSNGSDAVQSPFSVRPGHGVLEDSGRIRLRISMPQQIDLYFTVIFGFWLGICDRPLHSVL